MAGNIITPAAFGGSAVQAVQYGTSQDLQYNSKGGANLQSNPISGGCTLIEIAAHVLGSGVRLAFGLNPDATQGTQKLIPGSGTWFVCVQPGWRVAAISDDSNSGFINITEAAHQG